MNTLDLTTFRSFIGTNGEWKQSLFHIILSLLVEIWSIIGWWAIIYYVIHYANYSNWWQSFTKDFCKKIFPIIGTAIINGLLVFLCILLFIIPGIIFGIYWIFATTISMDSSLWWRSAIKESKKLIMGKWRDVFWINLWFGIVIGIFYALCWYIWYLWYLYFWRNPLIDIFLNLSWFIVIMLQSVFLGHLYLYLKENYFAKNDIVKID